jgi:uncharacterized GH25 family protein
VYLNSMCIKRMAIAVTILVAGIASPGFLWAHDFYLEPSVLNLKPADPVKISIIQLNVDQSETIPFYDGLASRFDLTSPGGTATIDSQIGDDPAATIHPSVPGYHIVAFVSQPRTADLATKKFRLYVQDKGMEAIIGDTPLPAGIVPEIYTRYSKVILAVGNNPPGTGYDKPVGLKLELVPGKNLPTWKPNTPLTLRLFYQGKPLQGTQVQFFSPGRWKNRITLRTDSDGRINTQVPHAGMWVATAVHMIPSTDPKHNWESFWASLTFEVKE